MKKLLIGLILALLVTVMPIGTVLAATTADITVTATGTYIAITVDVTSKAFGTVAASSTPNTTTSFFTIDNTSSVQTDQTIAVTTATWSSAGAGWTHNDAGTPGANTAALLANKGGTWGVGDVIIKNAAPLNIAENQTALADYSFGIRLLAPTSFTDGQQNTIIVRVTAAAG